mgnify:CR=1 FL=1
MRFVFKMIVFPFWLLTTFLALMLKWTLNLSAFVLALFPAHAGVIPTTRASSSHRITFPRTRGGDLKGKRRMVSLPGRLATDQKAAADEKIRLYKFDGKSLCKTPYCNI